MTYWPPDNLTVHLPRRYLQLSRGVAGLWWDGGASNGLPRSGKGVYARSYAITRSEAVFTPQPLYLDGRVLEFEEDEGLERGSSARITRVVSTNKDDAASYASRTVVTPTGVDESVAGIRAARLESIIGLNSWADQAAADLASFARKEGAAWHLVGTVRWRTALSGGFEEATAANVLLYGGEIQSYFFLQSTWLPAFGIRPVFGVIGQTIAYRDGGWELELELSPVVTEAPQHAITWDEIDDGSTAYEVQWWDGDNQRGLHDSLTYEDLGHVSTGLNVTTIPPDRGWDGR
jgi:hypothetical protein